MLRKRKKKDSSEVYQVRQVSNILSIPSINNSNDEALETLMKRFHKVLKEDLSKGLPTERDIDHENEVYLNSQAPHCGIFQPSSTELFAIKEYITCLL